MKKRLLALLILVVMLLQGCSSSYDPNGPLTMEWENGSIKYKGKDTGLTAYYGYSAEAIGGQGGIDYNFSLDTDCASVANITPNTQGVEEADMSSYKKIKYYQEYLGTKLTAAEEVADQTYNVCQCYLNGNNPELAIQYVGQYMDNLRMTNGSFYVDFGPFTFGSGYDSIKLTNEGASVSGTIKITQGSKGAATPYTLTQDKKSANMMMTSTEKYDYYEYEGYLIQIAKGIDLSTYITLN